MKIEILNNWNAKTLEDINFIDLNGDEHTIKTGFEFDWGSLPRPLWFISHPFYYKFIKAFCVHDWLYDNNKLSREHADQLFMNMVSKEEAFEAIIFYIGVRLFWSKFYND